MRYVLYLHGLRPIDEHKRAYIPIFEDIGIAKAFILTFMANEPIIPNGNVLAWGETYTLKASRLADILAATEGTLPEIYARQILQFKYGQWESRTAKAQVEGTTTDNATGAAAPSSARVKRASVPPGYVSITDLAKRWDMPAMHARTMLRATDRVKPDYGWWFAPADIPAIAKICGVK